jgi:hypothetical protein
MAISRALLKLVRIRDLEEEQCRVVLESALGDLNMLRRAQAGTVERDRRGRLLLNASAHSGELPDRLAGIEEMCAAIRLALVLAPRIEDTEQDVENLREDFLAKRVERRQAETLVEEAETQAALEGERRSQQSLDDWFRNRLHKEVAETARTLLRGTGLDYSETRQ